MLNDAKERRRAAESSELGCLSWLHRVCVCSRSWRDVQVVR